MCQPTFIELISAHHQPINVAIPPIPDLETTTITVNADNVPIPGAEVSKINEENGFWNEMRLMVVKQRFIPILKIILREMKKQFG